MTVKSPNTSGVTARIYWTQAQSSPSFNKEVCQKYFRKAFRCVIKNRHFQIPDWIPKFGAPKASFNTTPPSYKDICKIIKRMKASGSPCPLDQISVIPLKRCPFLRSYVTKICAVVWEKGQIPEAWRKAISISILIYKKGETLSSVHNTRRATQKLDLPFRKSCIGQKTLSYIGPKTWNNLPAQIKLNKSVNTFKHNIKKSFFDDLQKQNDDIFFYY